MDFEALIRKENRLRGRQLLSELREKHGLTERIKTEGETEDPQFEEIVARHPEEAASFAGEIEILRNGIREALQEADERMAGHDALKKVMAEVFNDDSMDATDRRLLGEAYAEATHVLGKKLRELLYQRKAAYYEVKWLLEKIPADGIMAEKIDECYGMEVGILDGSMKLCEVPGFIAPVEKEDFVFPDTELSTIFAVAEDVEKFFWANPDRFESQCLMSVIASTEELMTTINKAWRLLQEVERITLREDFKDLDMELRLRLYTIWLMAEMVNRIGYTVTELLTENKDRSVKEATEIFRGLLSYISYSELEQKSRRGLGILFAERGGIHVS